MTGVDGENYISTRILTHTESCTSLYTRRQSRSKKRLRMQEQQVAMNKKFMINYIHSKKSQLRIIFGRFYFVQLEFSKDDDRDGFFFFFLEQFSSVLT